jgi:3'-5' exoribonuclease
MQLQEATAAKKQWVNELKAGHPVDSPFLIAKKELASFSQPNRSGDTHFLRLDLADATGTIRSVAWENGPAIHEKFKTGEIVRVLGDATDYKGTLQLTIRKIEALNPALVDRSWFQRTSSRNADEMRAGLSRIRASISDPHLSKLLSSFFDDPAFLSRFLAAPAAKSNHHACVGGLLEHTLEVANLCRSFQAMYPRLNLGLLYTGALLHDIGKLEEYDASSLSFDLTTPGKLLGHIYIGATMVEERIKTLPGFPPELRLALAHMILSSHGEKENGSPEVPKTFEAFALHYADLVSARLSGFAQVLENGQPENGWIGWDKRLEREVYLAQGG